MRLQGAQRVRPSVREQCVAHPRANSHKGGEVVIALALGHHLDRLERMAIRLEPAHRRERLGLLVGAHQRRVLLVADGDGSRCSAPSRGREVTNGGCSVNKETALPTTYLVHAMRQGRAELRVP